MIHSEENVAYKGLPLQEAVRRTKDEYVNPETRAATPGIEPFCSMLKRSYHRTYRHLSEKHLPWYVFDFAERDNIRDIDTVVQMSTLGRDMVGKRLTNPDLITLAGK